MSNSRVKRERGAAAAFPECWRLSSTQPRVTQTRPMAAGKSVVFLSALLALTFELPLPAQAQEATPAANQEQTPTLPPVVVIQQKTVTPASRPRGESSAETAAAENGQQAAASGPAVPGTGSGSSQPGMFSLGGINLMGGTVISNDQMWYFGKQTLPDAMALVPGVTEISPNNQRNETNLYVRGFDRWRVPLSVDGVRVYLPYDNRLDLGRFLTVDIAEVQIAKGYASVLDGPGAIGGAINLVTKRPTKELEVEMGSTMSFARDGSYEGFSSYGSVGTRRDHWYMLATGTVNDKNGWMLSENFQPNPAMGAGYQDSGWRNGSQSNDWRVSAKVGYTPNATDEYAVSMIYQNGSKGELLSVDQPISSQGKYWTTPDWNAASYYSHSTTRVGEASYINTKLYYNTFDNTIFMYDNYTLTTQNTTTKGDDSYYHDKAYGGSVEGGTDITNWDTLKGSFNYRRDIHTNYNIYFVQSNCPTGSLLVWNAATSSCTEPTQTDIEDTYSAALENTFHLTRKIDVVGGVSYDWRTLLQAEDVNSTGAEINYLNNSHVHGPFDGDAFNWQSAIVYRYSGDAKVYASVSDRTRFPTLFERFSTKFGTTVSNPDLAPEASTNYELGWAGKLYRANLSTAVFYNDVRNFIDSVTLTSGPNAGMYEDMNVGNGHFYGWEGAADIPVTSSLSTGGNVTLMHRDLTENLNPAYTLTGVPDAKGIFYVKWFPIDALSITPNAEWATHRLTQSLTNTSLYYETGAYVLANISAEYKFAQNASFLVTAHNLFDQNYSLTDGYPEAGRSFTVGMKMKF